MERTATYIIRRHFISRLKIQGLKTDKSKCCQGSSLIQSVSSLHQKLLVEDQYSDFFLIGQNNVLQKLTSSNEILLVSGMGLVANRADCVSHKYGKENNWWRGVWTSML